MAKQVDIDNLDSWFPREDQDTQAAPNLLDDTRGRRLGVVIGGSLNKGLDVKLDRETEIEDLAVGRYVVVRGKHKRFFCMVTDIVLDSTNPAIRSDPPDLSDPFLSDIFVGTAAFGTVHVAPMLSIDEESSEPKPVKTIPSHFMPVEIATAQDVNDVFGSEDATHFNVGSPLELEQTQVNLDLRRLVERSSGVFGKSGTGKSFLTRVILAGVIQRDQAIALIFDMHNDYGWEAPDERGTHVKGLRQLFPGKVSIFTLDPESSQRRQAKYDHVVEIGYDELEPDDLATLKTTMDLSDAMIDAARTLHKKWGPNWILRLLNASADEIDHVIENSNISSASLAALSRRLERFTRFKFLTPESVGNSANKIIEYIEAHKSIVLEFGRYGSALEAYILVANYLTRRIHQTYVDRVEKALGDKAMAPPQLLITIEEAHKFLDPLIARQTIFGTIARELRKYNVTLLIVDQRPSGIDEEVMSQIGTRITALLDNERDISAVLTGISGASGLREVLARLDTKQQAIIMGHAVPMPVVVRTRAYDSEFYKALGSPSDEEAATFRKQISTGTNKRRLS